MSRMPNPYSVLIAASLAVSATPAAAQFATSAAGDDATVVAATTRDGTQLMMNRGDLKRFTFQVAAGMADHNGSLFFKMNFDNPHTQNDASASGFQDAPSEAPKLIAMLLEADGPSEGVKARVELSKTPWAPGELLGEKNDSIKLHCEIEPKKEGIKRKAFCALPGSAFKL